ncbi:MAG: DUF2521 family protein [Sporolactobacillus sp.]
MAIIMDFQERRYYKQLNFERQALRELSFERIERAIHQNFDGYLKRIPASGQTALDMSAEYALEAYLLGASMARFGFYGEEKQIVRQRSTHAMTVLIHDFYEFWLFWSADDPTMTDLEDTCRLYLNFWWEDGFESALKRRRLKLPTF